MSRKPINVILDVLLHYKTENGILLQDVFKKEIGYFSIFEIAEYIENELNSTFEIKKK